MTPPITDTEPPAQSQKIWTDLEVLELLAKHTYDEVHALTRWSRGRIYAAACRHSARKNEHRILARRKNRLELQREFLQQAMNVTERMDALDYLSGIPDDSVSCVLSSPPYNLGKSYGESGAGVDALRFSYYYGWLVMVVAEMARILKPGGTLCLQVGQTVDWAGSLYPIDVMKRICVAQASRTKVAWPGFSVMGLRPKNG